MIVNAVCFSFSVWPSTCQTVQHLYVLFLFFLSLVDLVWFMESLPHSCRALIYQRFCSGKWWPGVDVYLLTLWLILREHKGEYVSHIHVRVHILSCASDVCVCVGVWLASLCQGCQQLLPAWESYQDVRLVEHVHVCWRSGWHTVGSKFSAVTSMTTMFHDYLSRFMRKPGSWHFISVFRLQTSLMKNFLKIPSWKPFSKISCS